MLTFKNIQKQVVSNKRTAIFEFIRHRKKERNREIRMKFDNTLNLVSSVFWIIHENGTCRHRTQWHARAFNSCSVAPSPT
jgi:hypothetical protein